MGEWDLRKEGSEGSRFISSPECKGRGNVEETGRGVGDEKSLGLSKWT